MKLENILIINNDTDDILAMKERLPADVKVFGATQNRAPVIAAMQPYDLIILDNDANNREESVGKETLRELRKRNISVPIIYTSFQPGRVDKSIVQTPGVTMVRTDRALELIAGQFGLTLREPPKKDKAEPQLSIILSYNPVEGYKPDMYGNGKLLVASYDKNARTDAKAVLGKKLDEIYSGFDWRKDRDNIRNIFVYDGRNGEDRPGVAASGLGHDIRMRVNVLACGCDWDRKRWLKDNCYVNLFKVGCGGREELGAIADAILGIDRPGGDYLPMPRDKVLEPGEKFAF